MTPEQEQLLRSLLSEIKALRKDLKSQNSISKANPLYTHLNSKEALQVLGLWNPADGTKPNHRYLKWLEDRELLPRIKLGHRKIVYDYEDCTTLFEKSKRTGLSLTAKPSSD